jgi:hypothetical protein
MTLFAIPEKQFFLFFSVLVSEVFQEQEIQKTGVTYLMSQNALLKVLTAVAVIAAFISFGSAIYLVNDNASLKQFRLSPSFWINRLITRKWIRRHLSRCELVYTMTQMQKQEYEAEFGCRMKILCKSAEFEPRSRETGDPIRLIYGGGLYLNRWKILAKIRDVLEELNQNGVRAQLHIYSGSKLSPGRTKLLHDEKNAFLHQAIGYGELMERYRHADIAIHAEAFDLKNRLITRLSFSTKIIDCMSSGCAILAVGPEGQAGLSYLRENDAAVCVSDTKALHGAIAELVEHREKIVIYARKAC